MKHTELFGTDGIRARAGEFPLNAATIVAIGQAIGESLGGELLLGQDTRVSSPWIFELLKQGVARTNALVRDAGVIPTPGVALLTKHNRFSGGVMISASHNPYEDNGVKVFASDGTKLSDEAEARIEKRVFALISGEVETQIDTVPARQVTAENSTEWPDRYKELLLSHFPLGQWLKGFRIVMDCANGAMSKVAPSVLQRLGAETIVVNAAPNGVNINEHCGAVHIEALLGAMKNAKADFGVAFDGDGDRSLFASGSGRALDGDAVLLIMARRMSPAVVVGTSMTNYALEKKLESEGIKLTRVAVGDRYIFEEMQKGGGALGGEPSGHIIFSDFRLSGDGLLTTLKVAQEAAERRTSLDDLTRDWTEAPQLLKGVRVKEKVPIESMPTLRARMDEAARELEGRGRMVIRYSGTEPLLRVMLESDDAQRNERLMETLLAAIRRDLKL